MRISSTHVTASALVSQNTHVQDFLLQLGSDFILWSQQKILRVMNSSQL